MASNEEDLIYPGTLAYKNKFGEKNVELLSRLESVIVLFKSSDLDEETQGHGLGIERLKAIHKHLFDRLYDWAGELRQSTASKLSNEKNFAEPDQLSEKIKDIDLFLQNSGIVDPNYKMFKDEFASSAAELYDKINAAHIFEEGNGRASREYIRILAEANGLSFNFTENHKEEWHRASKKSFEGNIVPLKLLFRKLCDHPENKIENAPGNRKIKESLDFISLFDPDLTKELESKFNTNNDVEGYLNKKGISSKNLEKDGHSQSIEPS